MVSLDQRTRGYELASSERNLTFVKEFENIGFVRIKDRYENSFYLDPSPFSKTRKNEYFILKNCPVPMSELYNGILIEVLVSETEKIVNWKRTETDSFTTIKYVSNCRTVHPNKIINNPIISQEDFLNYISIPIGDQWDITDIQYCTGLYMVSSPQLYSEIKGGINTVVLANNDESKKLGAFKRITNIVPKEFQTPSANNYYFLTERYETRKSLVSTEINGAYFNITNYPVHIPVPFDVKYKKTTEYKENFDSVLPLAQGFMIDTLLFKPFIPDNLTKRMEEAMYFIIEEYFNQYQVPFCVDLGNVVPKLVTSFARLNFNNIVTINEINNSKSLWASSFERAARTSKDQYNSDRFYRNTSYTDILINEIRELHSTGVRLFISEIKAKSKVPEWMFEETLEKLCVAGIIYFKSNEEIGFLDI